MKPPKRCAWAGDNPLMTRYHDEQWGVPVHDDTMLFEMLTLEGAQAEWFDTAALYGPATFAVTPASDRMGLRLSGPALPVPRRELLSEPVCPGSVQVTRDGQCIVLGVDGQTIGGYPKVAQVISADLDRVGRLRPGDGVRFQRVQLGEAKWLYHARQRLLREWVTRLRTAELFTP